MINNGHVTHPDLWMLWYAVWFCAVLTLYHSISIIYWFKAHVFISIVKEWKFTAYRMFYDGWHHVAHIGPVQAEIYTWNTWGETS